MVRLIKRYESRKLYDTEESRYVSLEDVAAWVRGGQEVRVLDNASSEDVTRQTLTQIILDEGRKGTSFLPSELLHELVRIGEQAMSTGVEQLQNSVDRILKASADRLAPVRRAREEMGLLRLRLEELESSLAALETGRSTGGPRPERARVAKAPKSPKSPKAPRSEVSARAKRKTPTRSGKAGGTSR